MFLLSFIIGILVHEVAHLLCAQWLGVHVKQFGVSWRGVYLVRDSGTDVQNLAITLAGPMSNLLLSSTFLLAPWLGIHAIVFAMVNFGLGASNLLPLPSLDGSRALALLRKYRAIEAVQA